MIRLRRTAAGPRRAFSLPEIMVAMTVGLVVTTLAYSLVVQIQHGARRVDHRANAVNDGEAALRRIEGELAFIVPYGFPGCDFSLEAFEADRIRFFSSRDLAHPERPTDPFRTDGELRLVELRLERAMAVTEEGVARRIPDRLVLSTVSQTAADDEPSGATRVLHAFDPLLDVSFEITVLGSTADRGRPAGLDIGFEVSPLSPGNTPVPPIRLATTWIEPSPREALP